MRGQKRALRPMELWNPGAIEKWLEDEAARGWQLVDCGRVLATFTAVEPGDYRVRLRPQLPETPEARRERGAACREMGWDCTAVIVGDDDYDCEVFYCSDPSAPELDTDPVAYGWAWETLLRHSWRVAWAMLGLLVALPLLLTALTPGRSALEVLLRQNLSWLLWLAGIALVGIVMLRRLWYLRRMRRELAAGIPVGHTAPYGCRARLWRIYWVVGVLLALLCIVDTFGDSDQRFYLPGDPLPVVSASALGCPDDDDSGELHREPLTGDRLYVWQGGPANGWSTACHWEVYDLRLSFLAPQLLRDLVRAEVKGEAGLSPELVADQRFDEVRWLQVADGTQYLLARRDGRVVYLRADVPELLTDHLAELDRAMDLPIPVR